MSTTHLAAKAVAYLQDLANQQRFSGAVFMARRGEILTSHGYGMANLEHDVPNTPQTRFRIASLSKPLTATAILLLQERGLLHVQDHIATYLEDCPAAWQEMTIEQLLTHSSGIPDYTLFPAFHQQHMLMQRWSPDGLVSLFRDTPLDFQPGERYRYSNSGYVVLGVIIERVSNMSYGSFVGQAIFEPLHMAGSGYDDSRSVLKQRASGYVDTTLRAEYVDTSVSYAAGGLYSTIEDLYRWDQALYTDQLLLYSSREMMFTKSISMSPETLYTGGYGYGWAVVQAFDPRTSRQVDFAEHGGFIPGFAAHMRRYCYNGERATIIVLSNFERVAMSQIIADLQALLFESQ